MNAYAGEIPEEQQPARTSGSGGLTYMSVFFTCTDGAHAPKIYSGVLRSFPATRCAARQHQPV